VSAAVDVFLDPSRYLAIATSHSLRNILDRLLVVVQASAKRMLEIFGPDITQCPGYRVALIETSVVVSAALAAYAVEQELRSRNSRGIRAVYSIYLLETREGWAPHPGTAIWTGLADPPSDPAAFPELGNAVINSNRITSLLKAG
jgi:carbonic anhydrase